MRLIALLLLVFITACDKEANIEKTQLAKVKLLLNWIPEAEHGGYYEALLKGFYEAEGLEVEIISGGPGIRVESETALQRVQFGIANADKLLIVRDKDMQLQSLMAPFEESPRCLIFHKELNVKSFEELSKAKVLILNNTNPYYHWLIYKFPNLKNIDTIPYNKASFMSDKNAVIQGYTNSEPLLFREKGLNIDYLKVSQTGFNPYSSVLFCSEELQKKNPELVKKMVAASVKGWLSYITQPDLTNQHLEKINPSNKGTLQQSTKEMIKLLSSPNENFGKMNLQRWETLANQLKEIKLIDEIPNDLKKFINFE